DIRGVDRFYHIKVFRDIRIHVEPGRLRTVLESGGRTFDALTMPTVATEPFTVTFDTHVERTPAMQIMTNLFDVYGVTVLRGRTFLPSDVDATTPPVIISDRFA